METDFYKKCFVVLVNEVVPRAKKLNISLNEFLEPRILSCLVKLEYDNIITRRDLRQLLDQRVKYIDSIQKDTLEELSQHG